MVRARAPGEGVILDGQALRERFAQPRAWQPVQTGDRPTTTAAASARAAAVLILLVERPEGLHLLLTRRTDHLHDHAGQISCPGGRVEPTDRDPIETALRETEEEIGLERSRIEILGSLGPQGIYRTGTGYHVTPVVGLTRLPLILAPDSFEVAEVFEVPLDVVLDPHNHQRNTVVNLGASRQYHAIPYGRYYIWGANAAMLLNFRAFLQPLPWGEPS
jgi:8-oxo-dGTP pyrophosphatase MutT (NUDIX family)